MTTHTSEPAPPLSWTLKALSPFSAVNSGLLATVPPLERDESCDVAIIGAGVTGALIADRLTSDGLSVLVLDKREAAHGSTCASTGLLQYEIDVSLRELIELHGEQHAVRAYRLCAEAIDRIESVVISLNDDCEFHRRPSCFGTTVLTYGFSKQPRLPSDFASVRQERSGQRWGERLTLIG
jgi:glycine/D-amino acid oxidase-like deaminating enzyme